jgi:hypothetical protein
MDQRAATLNTIIYTSPSIPFVLTLVGGERRFVGLLLDLMVAACVALIKIRGVM